MGSGLNDYSRLATSPSPSTIRVIDEADKVVDTDPLDDPGSIISNPDESKVYIPNQTKIDTLMSSEMRSGLSYYSLVANLGSSTLSVIDETDMVVSTITNPNFPVDIAFSPDGKKAYVTIGIQNNVIAIDTSDNTISTTIPVGNLPISVAFSPDGKKAYVTNRNGNNVSVINPKTDTVTGTPISVGESPEDVAFSPSQMKAYVTNLGDKSISVINTKTNTTTTTIPDKFDPSSIAFSPDGNKAYVTNSGGDLVSVINTSNNTESGTIPVGSFPFDVAFNPKRMAHRAYVTNQGSNNVSVINTTTNTVTGSPISVGNLPRGVGFSPDGLKAYVANFQSRNPGNVSVINTRDNTVSATINVGNNPQTLAFSPLFVTGKYTTSGDKQMTKDGIQSHFISFAGGTLKASEDFESKRKVYLSNGISAIKKSRQGGKVNTHGRTVTLAGGSSGPGGLTVTGKGKLILAGKNTYSGPTHIDAGTLELRGSLEHSEVIVEDVGTLSGTGVIKSLRVNSGSSVSPGNSHQVGALFVDGNSTVLDGKYKYNLNGRRKHDLIKDAGPVTLGCESILKIKPQGNLECYPKTGLYTVLEGSLVEGTFAEVKLSKSFRPHFTFDLIYTPTKVLLSLHKIKRTTCEINENEDRTMRMHSNYQHSTCHQKERLLDLNE